MIFLLSKRVCRILKEDILLFLYLFKLRGVCSQTMLRSTRESFSEIISQPGLFYWIGWCVCLGFVVTPGRPRTTLVVLGDLQLCIGGCVVLEIELASSTHCSYPVSLPDSQPRFSVEKCHRLERESSKGWSTQLLSCTREVFEFLVLHGLRAMLGEASKHFLAPPQDKPLNVASAQSWDHKRSDIV